MDGPELTFQSTALPALQAIATTSCSGGGSSVASAFALAVAFKIGGVEFAQSFANSFSIQFPAFPGGCPRCLTQAFGLAQVSLT